MTVAMPNHEDILHVGCMENNYISTILVHSSIYTIYSGIYIHVYSTYIVSSCKE